MTMKTKTKMRSGSPRTGRFGFGLHLILTLTFIVAAAVPAAPQERGNPEGEWRYLGGDASHTRYSPLDQIDAGNFEDLEVAWVWRGTTSVPPSTISSVPPRSTWTDSCTPWPASAARWPPSTRLRRDHLDLSRAPYHAVRAGHAEQLREGRGLRRRGWPWGDLYQQPSVLPPRTGREDRPYTWKTGRTSAAARLSQTGVVDMLRTS